MRYAFIKAHHVQWNVLRLCRLFNAHPSGYYAWLKEPKSARARANERLLGHIKQYWLESGGSGYVSKGADTEELSQAIRTVAGGEFYISQDVAQNIALEESGCGQIGGLDSLSNREIQLSPTHRGCPA